MFFNYSQTAFMVGGIVQFPDFVFCTVPLQPSQILDTSMTQGSSTNTVSITGTTQQVDG